jgi:hypothetical protein
MRSIVTLLLLVSAVRGEIRFREQEIQRGFGVGYAVLDADINGDGKTDIVAINPTQAVWFENPSWEKHVIMDGATKRDNVCIAAHDIDGDGLPDLALGADWQPRNTTSGGTLQWIGRKPTDPKGHWSLTAITQEPTLHRIRWGDVDGDGRKELVVAPLHGRENKPPRWEGQGARLLVLRVPKDPRRDAWPLEVADDTLHIVHNFLVTNVDRDRQEEILTASREGVSLLKRGAGGKWTRKVIGEGSPGEIKMGRAAGKRYLATVEPWHGNSIVVYEEAAGTWPRQVIESELTGAHALGWGDFDGDGDEELAVGWRDKKPGVAVYKRGRDGNWKRELLVDDGGMATEDLTVADLNGDRRPEIIAVGRATGNVKIYWNESPPRSAAR